MTNLQYSFDILVSFISYCVLIFVFLNLWNYIYQDPDKLINGYNMNQMIWYVIVTEILWMSLDGRKLCKKISNDVRSGNIAYNINKPYNYVEYAFCNHMGMVIIRFIMVTILGITLGLIFLHTFPSLTIFGGLVVLVSCFLGTTINMYLVIAIGLISFYIEDSNPFFWLYSKMILVIGTLFPVEFFPSFILSLGGLPRFFLGSNNS